MLEAGASGNIREVEESKPGKADVGNEILLKYALQRRGVALEVANVCSYLTHSLLVETFFDALLRAPIPGFSKVTMNQLRQADEEMWRRIASSCRDGLRLSLYGDRPFEKALKDNLFEPGFRYLLMPLPGRAPASIGNGGEDSKLKRKISQLEAENKELRKSSSSGSGDYYAKGRGKGKNKDKGKLANGGARIGAMEGKARTTAAGEPLCFNFNIKGCPKAKPGERCDRGWHLCAEIGCQKPHPMREH